MITSYHNSATNSAHACTPADFGFEFSERVLSKWQGRHSVWVFRQVKHCSRLYPVAQCGRLRACPALPHFTQRQPSLSFANFRTTSQRLPLLRIRLTTPTPFHHLEALRQCDYQPKSPKLKQQQHHLGPGGVSLPPSASQALELPAASVTTLASDIALLSNRLSTGTTSPSSTLRLINRTSSAPSLENLGPAQRLEHMENLWR